MDTNSVKLKRRWRGLRISRVYMGVFDFSVHFAIGDQSVAVKYVLWLHRSDEMQGATPPVERRGFCAHRDGYCPVIWLPRRPRTAREYATLAHECLHAVGHLTRWAGIAHGEETEEVFCHALAHLVNAGVSASGEKEPTDA